MRRRTLLGIGVSTLLGACAAPSYGVRSDGIFPPRPVGADYPNWEHLCVVASKGDVSETLNNSGKTGWELVAVAPRQGGDSLMCFKRAKPLGER